MFRYRSHLLVGVLLCSVLLASTAFTAVPQQSTPTAFKGQFQIGAGIANDLLQSWWLQAFEGGMIGRYYEVLHAPLCSEADTPGCRMSADAPAHTILLVVERAESEGTQPGDEHPALLRSWGYQPEAALVGGFPAVRYTHNEPAADYAVAYTLEVADVYYQIAFSNTFLVDQALIDQIVAGFVLTPANAPAPFLANADTTLPTDPTPLPTDPTPLPTDPTPLPTDPTPLPTDPTTAQQTTLYLPLMQRGLHISAALGDAMQVMNTLAGPGRFPGLVIDSFGTQRLVDLAIYWGPRNTNPDRYDVGANGALFIDCMLRYAGYAPARCGGSSAALSYINMNTLYAGLAASGAVEIARSTLGGSENGVQLGDIVFYSYQGVRNYCWGGIVTRITTNGPTRTIQIATNTQPNAYANVTSLLCQNSSGQLVPVDRYYLRLDSAAPRAEFLTPTASEAFRLVPGVRTFTYRGYEEPISAMPSSGVSNFTVAMNLNEQTTLLTARNPETALAINLDYPCREADFAVVAHDASGNARLENGGFLDGFILLRGDANADGVIDEADYALIRAADGLNSTQPGYSPALDPTGDGQINAADRIWIELYMSYACPQP
jgi:hypothetical protein